MKKRKVGNAVVDGTIFIGGCICACLLFFICLFSWRMFKSAYRNTFTDNEKIVTVDYTIHRSTGDQHIVKDFTMNVPDNDEFRYRVTSSNGVINAVVMSTEELALGDECVCIYTGISDVTVNSIKLK